MTSVPLVGCVATDLSPVPVEMLEPGGDQGVVEIDVALADEPPAQTAIGRVSPQRLWLQIDRIAFSRDAEGCAEPVTVFQAESPEPSEIGTGAGQPVYGTAPVGTYPCIVVTVGSRFSWAAPEDGPCSEVRSQEFHATPDADDTRTLYLTTGDPRIVTRNLHGQSIYPLAEAFEQTPEILSSRLLIDAVGRIDAETCRFAEAPQFHYVARWD